MTSFRCFSLPMIALLIASAAHAGDTLRLKSGGDVRLDDPGISRHHAELLAGSNGVAVCDLGSANGTYLNERRLQMPEVLREGDLLRLGDIELRFQAPAAGGGHGIPTLATPVTVLLAPQPPEAPAAAGPARETAASPGRPAGVDPIAPTLTLRGLDPEEERWRVASRDAATGVHSFAYLLDALQRELLGAHRSGRPLALLSLDLDHFRDFNTRWSRRAGDAVLQRVAQLVQATVRTTDIVARTGGEAFAVVLPDCDPQAARALAERVRQAVAQLRIEGTPPGAGAPQQHRQTISVGVADLEPDMARAEDLLRLADRRLFAAKHAGRDRVAA